MLTLEQTLADQLDIKALCQPQNLNRFEFFGANDNYNLKSSHFFPALIKKIHLAKINRKKKLTMIGRLRGKRLNVLSGDFRFKK